MRYFALIFVLVFAFCFSSANAQLLQNEKPVDSSTTWQLFKYDIKTAFNGVTHAFSRPAHWKKKDFNTLGALLIGTVALTGVDNEVNTFFSRQQSSFPEVVRDFGWYSGSPQNYFVATAGIYGFGLFTKNEKIRKTGILIIASSFTSGLLQSIGKNAIGRARPTAKIGPVAFDPFSKASKFHSFPSGHTVLLTTMSHAIAKQFDNTWTKIGIYSLGSIAPISRLLDGAHWLTDVAFSAALSIIVVDSIDKFLFNSKAYDYHKKGKKISWNFRFSGNQIGFVGTF